LSNPPPLPRVSVDDGTRRFEFNDESAFLAYLSKTTSSSTVTMSSYLEEFKTFPRVDNVLITYFDETTRTAESGLRLGPTILMGTISELLIVKLLKSIGEYLEDPNVLDNYYRKRTMTAKQTYAMEIVRRGHERINEPTPLEAAEESIFTEFNNIVQHLFDSIRLRRNEYVHPKPDITLNELPTTDVVRANVQAFNPYAKIILRLIEIFDRQS